MDANHDDWDVQQAYKEDPKKAIFFISSNLLQPEKLASRIVAAINSQTLLQEAIKELHIKHVSKDLDVHNAIIDLIKKR